MSMAAPGASARRLTRPEASLRRRHLHGAFTVVLLATIVAASFAIDAPWSTAVALLASGAGAGYSLSGSV